MLDLEVLEFSRVENGSFRGVENAVLDQSISKVVVWLQHVLLRFWNERNWHLENLYSFLVL